MRYALKTGHATLLNTGGYAKLNRPRFNPIAETWTSANSTAFDCQKSPRVTKTHHRLCYSNGRSRRDKQNTFAPSEKRSPSLAAASISMLTSACFCSASLSLIFSSAIALCPNSESKLSRESLVTVRREGSGSAECGCGQNNLPLSQLSVRAARCARCWLGSARVAGKRKECARPGWGRAFSFQCSLLLLHSGIPQHIFRWLPTGSATGLCFESAAHPHNILFLYFLWRHLTSVWSSNAALCFFISVVLLLALKTKRWIFLNLSRVRIFNNQGFNFNFTSKLTSLKFKKEKN